MTAMAMGRVEAKRVEQNEQHQRSVEPDSPEWLIAIPDADIRRVAEQMLLLSKAHREIVASTVATLAQTNDEPRQ